ncbi:ferritin-like domain-containing protein [Hymenobacter sp. 5317J-9]|uniref:ferritin-like domain-containing protein n=1 Tax=Hymenobacter sp. 5317J-9 TaxID=2932250 RepID=UPI001FD6F2CC|nr:ferritin-like domain-containing protein [Hymenobacter sp. 5317J-9]UOQ98536.1 ferritin-like domain-containing protein [Hymenobacter sp. 5317J-9]
MSEHSFSPAWRAQPLGRRGFLRVSAASAATVALVAATGCDTSTPEPVAPDPNLITLPAGDNGLLYSLFLLALAKSTLYQKVYETPPTDLTTAERAIFSDLRDHEIAYRELLHLLLDPNYLDSTKAVQLFPVDFAFKLTSFTLTTRAGVLAAAQQLEDLAAALYPVVVPLVASSAPYQRVLLLKAASVQARHAAVVRDLLTPGSFASDDVVNAAGQLKPRTPVEVNTALAPFFAPYVISVANLPVPVL